MNDVPFNDAPEEAIEKLKGIIEGEPKPSKREYKTIKLYLAEDKQDLLRQVCKDIGEDYSRVEDGQSSIIWDIIEWVAPALRIRRYLMELVGPVINATPDRERCKELK